MPTNLGRQLDVVVASAFLLIGAASTALSYNNIKDLEVTQAVLFDDPLPRGTQVFDIRADGECVGHIDVTLNYLEVGHLVSKGLVLSQYKGTAIPVHISSDIKFNPLGQNDSF